MAITIKSYQTLINRPLSNAYLIQIIHH